MLPPVQEISKEGQNSGVLGPMNITYAIFEAEFKSSIRRNVESIKKRFAATMLIDLLGMIFSIACIRLVKFVDDNTE